MQVAIHLGVHCTDEERLLKSLLQNKGKLALEGVSVPGPGRYRKTLVRAAQKLQGEAATQESRDVLIDAIVDDDSTKRLVMTFEDFICVPGRIFENSMLYDKASYKPSWLRTLFPGDQVEFFLAVRNPATFIPAAFHHKSQNVDDFRTFLDGVNLEHIRWSDVIHSIQENNPGCPITVWCNEDTPLIWPQVLREITGVAKDVKLMGGMNILATIMKKEGMQRLRTYLSTHPTKGETQRRRILMAFLDKYAIEDAVEETLDVPGWSDDLVWALTEEYEDDLKEISELPGVKFIGP